MCSREINRNTQYNMREWLSGGAPPCQGGGRGFDPRLALCKTTKRTSEWEVLFCHPGSAGHFSKPNCFTVWLRFLGTLKCPSVVSAQRSTGPLDTHLAQHTGVTIIYFCISNIFDWFMNFVRDYFLFILYNEFYMGCVLLVNSR